MRASTRKTPSEEELYNLSLRALMRRAYSVHEMKEYLGRRAEEPAWVSRVVTRLREHKFLDDAKYALDYARRHANARRHGRFRIARELRGRGVPESHIDAALDKVFVETDEGSLVRARLKRRLAHLRGSIDRSKIASIYRSLLRAGFSADIIRAELRGVTHGDLPEIPDAADES